MNNTRAALLGMIEAVEQRYAGDAARLQQLSQLRRRIDEEIEATGFPPPLEIVETLLSLIIEGTLPTEDAFSEATAEAMEEELGQPTSPAADLDLSFRPESYWDFSKGRPYRATTRWDIPYLMTGEFLPPYRGGEVEIARIELQTTTGDVISLRARRCKRFIRYRVVDEYESDFKIKPQKSVLPLTLGELIGLIDNAPTWYGNHSLAIGSVEYWLKMGKDPDEYVNFVQVWSAFYPQLGDHYDAQIESLLMEWGERWEA